MKNVTPIILLQFFLVGLAGVAHAQFLTDLGSTKIDAMDCASDWI